METGAERPLFFWGDKSEQGDVSQGDASGDSLSACSFQSAKEFFACCFIAAVKRFILSLMEGREIAVLILSKLGIGSDDGRFTDIGGDIGDPLDIGQQIHEVGIRVNVALTASHAVQMIDL